MIEALLTIVAIIGMIVLTAILGIIMLIIYLSTKKKINHLDIVEELKYE